MTTRVMGCVDEEWGSIRRMRRCFRISARFAVLVAFTLPRLAVPAYAEPSASGALESESESTAKPACGPGSPQFDECQYPCHLTHKQPLWVIAVLLGARNSG